MVQNYSAREGNRRHEATTTHVRLELWRIPGHQLHKVTSSLREERLMAVLELWGKVLTCEVVIDIDEYSHGLCMEGIRCRQEEFNGHLEKLKIWHEEFAVHELNDRPERVRTRARAPLAEDRVCGLEYAEVDVHVAAAEGLYELLGW